jgi:adenine-specific DNA-methyltransferase
VNYIGSKHSLLNFIEETYDEVAGGKEKVFCDLFAGTGAVGRLFKRKGLRVIANDIQHYAYVLNKAYLEINRTPAFGGLRRAFQPQIEKYLEQFDQPVKAVLAFINQLPKRRGFITGNYSPKNNRFYYTEDNAAKTDAIRQAINKWYAAKLISKAEYFYLLCALLEAIDRVANTASVYGAFLKSFKNSAKKPLHLKPLELSNASRGCQVFQEDANQLIERIECDVLYMDPPYNHRQYGANYHVLETIAAYDAPELRGITGMRDYPRSLYCQPRSAKSAMRNLILSARTRHILVSYNDEGILSLDEVRELLSLRGEPLTFSRKYNRFKADNGRQYKRNQTIEYLHYVRVKKS